MAICLAWTRIQSSYHFYRFIFYSFWIYNTGISKHIDKLHEFCLRWFMNSFFFFFFFDSLVRLFWNRYFNVNVFVLYIFPTARKNKALQFVDWCIFSIDLDLVHMTSIYSFTLLFICFSIDPDIDREYIVQRKYLQFNRSHRLFWTFRKIYFYSDRNLIICIDDTFAQKQNWTR